MTCGSLNTTLAVPCIASLALRLRLCVVGLRATRNNAPGQMHQLLRNTSGRRASLPQERDSDSETDRARLRGGGLRERMSEREEKEREERGTGVERERERRERKES